MVMQPDSIPASNGGATSFPPSSSGGRSGSSNSNSNLNNNAALFNPDEVRFMDDSLSNAESFDPFTIGAPGFKVPNVLPANLGGIGSAPGSSSPPIASGSQARWSHHEGRRHSEMASMPNQFGFQSESPSVATPAPIRGGYGRDKAWQMQQLEALQMERERYIVGMRQNPPSSSAAGPLSAPPDFDFANETPLGHSLRDVGAAWGEQAQSFNLPDSSMPTTSAPYLSGQGEPPPGMPSNPSAQDLGHLGLRFPSSHHFPAAARNEEAASKRQRTGQRQQYEEDGEMQRRGRSPNARPPWTQPPDATQYSSGPTANGTTMSLGSSHDSLRHVKARQGANSSNAAQPEKTSKAPMTIDFDAPYTFLPAPKPPPKLVDLTKVPVGTAAIPLHLQDSFFSPTLPRYQPHLLILRQEQMRRKDRGLSANIRKGEKKAAALKQTSGSPDGVEGECAGTEKKKTGHTLLTEAEKKANHIASEQKRRANIRKGYEMLCDLVPSLREDDENGEGEGTDGGKAIRIGMDEDEADEEEEDIKPGAKRRRACETSGGGGGVTDRAGGPRSEAAILMAAVEHLRGQLELHQTLVARKQEAQLRVAQQYGLDIRAIPPPPADGGR